MPPKSTWPSPSERNRPARSSQRLEARIDALLAGRVELGVLDVKRLDALVVEVDEVQVVELLQQEVARVVVDAGSADDCRPARGTSRRSRRRAGPRPDGARSRRRRPASSKASRIGFQRRASSSKAVSIRPGRARRPRVEVGPGERAREGGVRGQAKPLARPWRQAASGRPPIPGAPCRIAAHLGRREAVEPRVVGRMDRHQLALQVGRELGHRDAGVARACP